MGATAYVTNKTTSSTVQIIVISFVVVNEHIYISFVGHF